MSHVRQTAGLSAASLPNPNLEWLRKQAKRRLEELRQANPAAQLADAQFDLARQYGFSSWRSLKAHVDSLTVDGQLFDAARKGDAGALAALLDAHPEKLHVRDEAVRAVAAAPRREQRTPGGRGPAAEAGPGRELREKGDNTYPMHWAAAAGHLEVVRRLADAGGDVVGHGDDHALEVIGWATCWDGADDAPSRTFSSAAARGTTSSPRSR